MSAARFTKARAAMLAAALNRPVPIDDRHGRRVANDLEGLGFGKVCWPGPRFVLNAAGRAVAKLAAEHVTPGEPFKGGTF